MKCVFCGKQIEGAWDFVCPKCVSTTDSKTTKKYQTLEEFFGKGQIWEVWCERGRYAVKPVGDKYAHMLMTARWMPHLAKFNIGQEPVMLTKAQLSGEPVVEKTLSESTVLEHRKTGERVMLARKNNDYWAVVRSDGTIADYFHVDFNRDLTATTLEQFLPKDDFSWEDWLVVGPCTGYKTEDE